MFATGLIGRIALLAVAVLVLWALFAGESGAGGPEQRYRVQPGDTLWSIASAVAPGQDLRPVVDALEAANGGTTLVAGQRLLIDLP